MLKNRINYFYLKQILKTDIIKYYNFLLESQYWSKDRIEEYQRHNLKKIIEFAYTNVKFYRNLFKKNDIMVRNENSHL